MQSPVDYFYRYHDITVPSPNGGDDLATGISVDRYRLGADQAHIDERVRLIRKVQKDLQILQKADPAAVLPVCVWMGDAYEEYSFSKGNDEQLSALLRYPYVGKGSPESIQIALQLAATELPDSPPIVRPENFQAYCDKWLGLDCNGFVGSFLRHEYSEIAWYDVNETPGIESNDLISSIWSKFDGVARNSAADVDANDLNLLCMVDNSGAIVPGGAPPHGHIMISVPGESDQIFNLGSKLGVSDDVGVPAIYVAESTGAKDPADDNKNGLVRSFYAYADRAGQPGVMKVVRGFNGTSLNVRVKGAPWSA